MKYTYTDWYSFADVTVVQAESEDKAEEIYIKMTEAKEDYFTKKLDGRQVNFKDSDVRETKEV